MYFQSMYPWDYQKNPESPCPGCGRSGWTYSLTIGPTLIGLQKLKEGIKTPTKATKGSSGFDVSSPEEVVIDPGKTVLIKTGFALKIPDSWEAQIRSRSGLSLKHGIVVLNSPGTIDSDYTGEVGVILHNTSTVPYTVKKDERIAQLVFNRVPDACLTEISDVGDTDRGSGGFGSTGK